MNLVDAIRNKDLPKAIELIKAGHYIKFSPYLETDIVVIVVITDDIITYKRILLHINYIRLYNFLIRIYK